mmetsp:Transcript_5790/g.16266  ORF Transcript_5790/g.16266 Transcript_5790/m.16266 type:complete len:435 (+) Transcript_5790:177-1481(+)|eukprot:CAMPEP_0117662652 /NCGR_PEP_ID=MMETSP0804-20121206/8164_1 /TAXON_ID=1074897 /ORGANISM="Tetraselmis astigmatica, Strain CCMP880" /LENGTH=434 /DNA_ID=CAMNT_0005469559 /DNA_START=125 /DNA_END=1429 /DNA_ORIENTATION=+
MTGSGMGTDTIHQAAWLGDREAVLRFVKAGTDMGYPAMETLQQRDGVTGDTPLHKAVENNKEDLVKWLLDEGVMPNVKDNHGVTPLHVAAIKGHIKLVELLLDSDSSIKKVTDANGDTAVHWASTKGHLEIVELLLSQGSALDIANKQGWTALHRAAFNGRVEVMERLLNAGASLHAVNQDCNTALHLAAFNNHLSAISLLLKWGAKTDMRNAEGLTPALCGSASGVKVVIEEWEITHPPKTKRMTRDSPPGTAQKPPTTPQRPTHPGRISSRAQKILDDPVEQKQITQRRTTTPPNLAIEVARDDEFTRAPGTAAHVKLDSDKAPEASPASSFSAPQASYRGLTSVNERPGSQAAPRSYRRSNSMKAMDKVNPSPALPPTPPAADKPWSVDIQDRIKSKNRAQEKQASKKRPESGNKKFLKGYNLDRLDLFAP